MIAVVIAVSDQLLKSWVVARYQRDVPSPVVVDWPIHLSFGDWLQIDFIHNSGGLFGLFQNTAPVFALVTIAVVAVLIGTQLVTGWRSWWFTLPLALLLGGAVGNFIDRITLGYVVDFADIGIGSWRFYIFNIADSAVTVAILMLLGLWILGPYLGIKAVSGGNGDAGDGEDGPQPGNPNRGLVVPDPTPDRDRS